MAFTQEWFDVNFGSAYAGLGTIGYRLYNATGGDAVARTTTGVQDLGAGSYGVASVSVPDTAVGIQWDTGGGSPVYAVEDIEPFRNRDAVDGKLPTNYIMGSSDQDDHDTDIDTILVRVDVATSTRTAPGAAMDLVTDALDADALAVSALAELNTYLETTASHGSGAWTGTTPSAVSAAVWSEALPGAFGAGEAGYILGTNLDASISSVIAAIDAMVTDAGTPFDPAGGLP